MMNFERETSMSQLLISTSVWLHALATVIFIGHYLLLALIYLPVLSNQEAGSERRAALGEISKRSRFWLYASLVIFIVTGIYLTVVDPNYLGLADFGNLWGILMLVKHILILGMIVLGFWYNAIMRVGPLLSSNTGAVQALARFRWHVNAMAVAGVLVLLLTALAQAQ
jgi:uncharacterized membrane protein